MERPIGAFCSGKDSVLNNFYNAELLSIFEAK